MDEYRVIPHEDFDLQTVLGVASCFGSVISETEADFVVEVEPKNAPLLELALVGIGLCELLEKANLPKSNEEEPAGVPISLVLEQVAAIQSEEANECNTKAHKMLLEGVRETLSILGGKSESLSPRVVAYILTARNPDRFKLDLPKIILQQEAPYNSSCIFLMTCSSQAFGRSKRSGYERLDLNGQELKYLAMAEAMASKGRLGYQYYLHQQIFKKLVLGENYKKEYRQAAPHRFGKKTLRLLQQAVRNVIR